MNSTRLAATFTVLGLFSVAATGLALAHPSVPVTLTVDGHVENVSTTAGTVRALLDSQNIAVGPRAEVNPGLDNVIYAHEHIQVSHPWHVVVKADGTTESAWTTADDVRAALTGIGVKVGQYDKVSVPLTSGHKDMTVVVKRGTGKDMTLNVTLAKPVKQVQDASMTQGTTKVLKAGQDGNEQAHLTVIYVDGKIDHVKVLNRKVTVKPVEEVRAVGTQPPPPAPAPAPAVPSGPSVAVPGNMSGAWARVAYCETGGNPSIVAGQFYGMYMMTLDAWRIAGGTGAPNQASAAEQTMRAQILYNQLGSRPWPVCGKYLP